MINKRIKAQGYNKIIKIYRLTIPLNNNYNNIPASEAEMYDAMVPQIIALNPSRARSALRVGAIAPIPPI